MWKLNFYVFNHKSHIDVSVILVQEGGMKVCKVWCHSLVFFHLILRSHDKFIRLTSIVCVSKDWLAKKRDLKRIREAQWCTLRAAHLWNSHFWWISHCGLELHMLNLTSQILHQYREQVFEILLVGVRLRVSLTAEKAELNHSRNSRKSSVSLYFSSRWQPVNHPVIAHLVSHCERLMKALCILKSAEAPHQYIKAIPYKVMTGAH